MEAHASDEWPMPIGEGQLAKFPQTKDTESRINNAKEFIEAFGLTIPVVVDTEANEFESQYAAWPERFYIIHQSKMAFVAFPGPMGYQRIENTIKTWLIDHNYQHLKT